MLRFQLGHARLKLLVIGQQGLITRRVHVVAMVVCPPGLVVNAAVEQPPPKQAAVRVVVSDPGTVGVRAEHIVNPSRTSLDYDSRRNVRWGLIIVPTGIWQWRRLGLIRTTPRNWLRDVPQWLWVLRFLEFAKLRFTGLLFPRPRCRRIERKPRTTRQTTVSAVLGFGPAWRETLTLRPAAR